MFTNYCYPEKLNQDMIDESSEGTNTTTQGNSSSIYNTASRSGDPLSEGSGLFLDPDTQGNGSIHNSSDGGFKNSEENAELLEPYESDLGSQNTSRFAVVSVYLPPALFRNLTTPDVGLLYSYYSTSSLFPMRNLNETEYPAIVSPVIGVLLADVEPVVNLTDPILMTLPYILVCTYMYM